MSEEQERVDWIAAHDQIRAEVIEVLDKRLPFMICWVVEDESGEPMHIATTGLCREDDDLQFIRAILQRRSAGHGFAYTSPRPGEEET